MARVIRPQLGPQEKFLASPADIVIYGGAAGGGKSYALLLEPLRHLTTVPGFGAVIFRRTTDQVRNVGGLWDESEDVYGPLGLKPKESVLEWEHAPTGNTLKFAHLEHEKNVHNWQGAQIPLIGFDELTHFTARQFWYMLSRNRSTCGVRPYLRATCNPDPDSFVADLIAWWIDQDPSSPTHGQAVPERGGVIRWFARINGEIHWADARQELLDRFPGPDTAPKSLTFIPSKLDDNPALTSKDPGYRANLLAQDPVEQARLLHGNWKARRTAGTLFQRAWFPVLDAVPELKTAWRAWDFAATRPTTDNPNPDWTRGVKVGETPSGQLVVLDVVSVRDGPGEVDLLYERTALADGPRVLIHVPQDPGAAGVKAARDLVRRTPVGHHVRSERVTGDKVTRARTASARAHAGLISVVKADWNDAFFAELEAFPDGQHDDIVDALADAVNALVGAGIKPDRKKLRAGMGLQ
ncbi:MAG TPA: phage terminase large subunit [Trueperaceae bacterium]|nr:phage terminase large subunit [Trueperaceae bacterium]